MAIPIKPKKKFSTALEGPLGPPEFDYPDYPDPPITFYSKDVKDMLGFLDRLDGSNLFDKTGYQPKTEVKEYKEPKTPDIEEEPEETVQEETNTVINKSNKSYNPDKYYASQLGILGGSLIGNMLQQPPPNISLKKTFLKRQKNDPSIMKNIMEDIQEGAAASTRRLREQTGQTSDFIAGSTALGANLNRAIQKMGESARQNQAQTTAMNTQIANQELAGLAETLNKEQLLNFGNQQQFAQMKQSALSSNLSEIGKAIRGYSDFKYKQDMMDKQQQYMKDYVERQDKLNTAIASAQLFQKMKSDPNYIQEKKDYLTENVLRIGNEFKEAYNLSPLELQENLKSYTDQETKFNTDITTLEEEMKAEGIDEQKKLEIQEKINNLNTQREDIIKQKESSQLLQQKYLEDIYSFQSGYEEKFLNERYGIEDPRMFYKNVFDIIKEGQNLDKYE